MNVRDFVRATVAAVFYVPFVLVAAVRFIVGKLTGQHPHDRDPDLPAEHRDSLSVEGMVGDIDATVATVFVSREEAQSLLPPQLELIAPERLPPWLRERDGHPLVMLIGFNEIGRRKFILGRYRTVPLFRQFMETFVAAPFVQPVGEDDAEPCFHFPRVFCKTFWPTELGRMCIGWPKRQCRMQSRREGDVELYEIGHPQNGRPHLSATTNLADPTPVPLDETSMRRVAEMLSQPLLLIRRGRLKKIDWNLRFGAAKLTAAAAEVTLHEGFFPDGNEAKTFALGRITEEEFGALRMQTTFLNRGEV